MSRIYKLITAACCAALLAACGSGSNTSEKAAAPAAAPDAKRVDAATAGSISGKVLLDGKAPENAKIGMSSDPTCMAAHTDGATAESYVVDNGALENVFVYIKDGLGNKYIFDTPTTPVTLEQRGCVYVPHVLGIRATQPLEIVNDDNTLHNVHGRPES